MMMTAPSAHLRRAPEAENVENETPAIVQTTLEEESTNFGENQNPQATGVGVASVEPSGEDAQRFAQEEDDAGFCGLVAEKSKFEI